MSEKKQVIIVGAGPAGLTAAYELIRSGKAVPLLLEASKEIGGISRTVNYKGFRMDIGGHRFFSKSDWVMEWWRDILPIDRHGDQTNAGIEISHENSNRQVNVDASEHQGLGDKVMLMRSRLSRIYFLRKYFDYPLKLNGATLSNLGPVRILRIGLSYIWARLLPRRKELSLEDFFVNRFGGELYQTFFKDYTEKVWGVRCNNISAEWGAQRIKGLSVMSALWHALQKWLPSPPLLGDKSVQTSLIEKFLYPKLGPGQLWEEVARRVIAEGGELRMGHTVVGINLVGNLVASLRVRDSDGHENVVEGDEFISTMPVKDLIQAMVPSPPAEVTTVAMELPYRDFITVGLLLEKMKSNRQSQSSESSNMPPDNWIYIQERDVRVGRLQIFNNWSPYLVADAQKVWLGMEYFCQEGDDLWSKSDQGMISFASAELEKIGMINAEDVLDGTVIRVPKSYPAYFGAYAKFEKVRQFVDGIDNLYLVGRNGMHRYNNQDHSMLTAKLAVESILSGNRDKTAIWNINIGDDYHEEKKHKSRRPPASH